MYYGKTSKKNGLDQRPATSGSIIHGRVQPANHSDQRSAVSGFLCKPGVKYCTVKRTILFGVKQYGQQACASGDL